MNKYFICNNIKIPFIGYGTWQLPEGCEAINCIKNAISVGYKHIDTASYYGTEESIGIAIEEMNIKRDEIFITSKVWNDDRGYDKTIKSFEKSIKKLKLNYIDLYLIHWPADINKYPDWEDINKSTWRALVDLYKSKKIKLIGVSNFKIKHLRTLIDQEIVPMVNQIEYHPGFIQSDVVDFCKENNILVEAWSPFAFGKVFKNDVLINLSKKYNRPISQICIKWCLDNNIIPLPKANSIEKMRENLDIDNFMLESDDILKINKITDKMFSGWDPSTIDF